jgi:hypothetical protein
MSKRPAQTSGSACADPEFRVRITGRFVLALEDAAKTLTAVGVNMHFNGDLHCEPHRTFLTISRSRVIGKISAFPDFSVFDAAAEVSAAGELFVWDVSGHDVRFSGAKSGWTVDPTEDAGWKNLPDLGGLSNGDVLNETLVAGDLPSRSPVATRVTLSGGTLSVGCFRRRQDGRIRTIVRRRSALDARCPVGAAA